jgi:subtilisin family serine protease
MESALAGVAAAARLSKNAGIAAAERQGLRVVNDRVGVVITTTPERADQASQAVRRTGGEVTGRVNGDRWLEAWLPAGALEQIAADASVDYVRRPMEALTTATTEGAGVINAPAWHAAGKTGAGVKVAVIDMGFQGYPALLGSDLPGFVTVKNFVDGETDAQVNGATPHGTACAEIVHDIAPAAQIYLAKVYWYTDLEEAVNWAKAQDVDVITTSLAWYSLTPGDGTGYFADLVQSARSAGILWVTSASNDREAHWGGAFNGSADGWQQFAGTQVINYFGPGNGNAYTINAGYPIRVFLRWDDWSAKTEDYDLYVVRWNGSAWQIVGQSLNRQTGGAGQTPVEWVSVLTTGSAAPYGFAVRRYSGSRNVNLEIFAPKVARLDELVTARSLANLADAPGAITVAALDVNAPYPQEYYSSEGPTNGPGGTEAGGAIKPDISGYANVSTASYPNSKFNGTSAAAPHVAGAAALVKSADPAYTPAQIQSFLEDRAIDVGEAGKDTRFGWGRLNLGAPLTAQKVYLPYILKPAVD